MSLFTGQGTGTKEVLFIGQSTPLNILISSRLTKKALSSMSACKHVEMV